MSKIEKNRTYYDPYNEIRCDKFALEKFVKESEEKDKTIADLEAKLADVEESARAVIDANFRIAEERDKLKHQLAEKDIEIERLKQNYDEVWEDTYFSVKEDFELNNNCNECRRYYAEEFNKQLISFAVEQLEKVKEIIANHTQELWTCENDDIDVVLYDEIDNQIKQLKEGK